MPSLICSSRYTIDSQILRRAAQELGWETLRLDGNSLPEWFEPSDSRIAFYYTAPHVFHLATQLERTMLGCPPDWTINLPQDLLRREMRQMRLREALDSIDRAFVKHSVSKAFPAAVYNASELDVATKDIHHDSLVHVCEPVLWEKEFRCFVVHQKVLTISPYLYNGQIAEDYESIPSVSQDELDTVRAFAEAALHREDVPAPAAFVMDVGFIRDRGWAVVECNECWASGIYGCEPGAVLETLLAGNTFQSNPAATDWDYSAHYLSACPGAAW